MNVEKQDGSWYWYSAGLTAGSHLITFQVKTGYKLAGTLNAFVSYMQEQKGSTIKVLTKNSNENRIMLPSESEKNLLRKTEKIGEMAIP